MKGFKLKKLVAMALTLATITAVSPVAASAAWKLDAHGYWNTEGNSYSTGWRSIDGQWYLFGADGYMKTGWVMDNGTWYFLQSDGAMKVGWIYNKFDDKWYYTDATGAMQYGRFITDAGNLYYLDENGAAKLGWFEVNGNKYYANADYYANYSSEVQIGVIQIVGKNYYFDKDGKLVTGEVTIDGVKYTLNKDGEFVGKGPRPVRAYDEKGKQVKVVYDDGDNKDKEEGSSSSHHNGGGGSGSSESSKVQGSYSAAAKVVANGNEVSFAVTADKFKAAKSDDYVTRDLMVEDGTVTKKAEGVYTVTPDAGKEAKVKGVVRIVRNGVVYYETSSQVTVK